MNNNSVLIGMSGGVDSSVAAYLLQQENYHCIGCTMQLYCQPGTGAPNVDDARSVARRMEIPFHVFDFQEDFHALEILYLALINYLYNPFLSILSF